MTSTMNPVEIIPWAPHEKAAPVTEKNDSSLSIQANGTGTLCGGWQLRYDGVEPGKAWRIEIDARHENLENPRDNLAVMAFWYELPPDAINRRLPHQWASLLRKRIDENTTRYYGRLVAPEFAECLMLRLTLRWSEHGKTTWSMPSIEPTESPKPRKPVRLCALTGHNQARQGIKTVQGNIGFYSDRCEKACEVDRPDLILLPEYCLQYEVPGSLLDSAVSVPGPESEVFAKIARRHKTRICLTVAERAEDRVHNAAILLGSDGNVIGRYRKTHLALTELDTGITPGDDLPVFDTDIGRIGMAICMDSSRGETARVLALRGAEIMLLPIMGDHRAERWSAGQSFFSEDRWRVIMRARAMDNLMTLAVARNRSAGSCVINPKGEIVTWNDGDQDWVTGEVDLDKQYRIWNGCERRNDLYIHRRPHLFTDFADPDNLGPLDYEYNR